MKKNGFLRRHLVRILLSTFIVVLFLLNTAGKIELGFVQPLENIAYDLRLRATMPNTVDKRIVIVDIDERSLKAQGHWPWSRNKLAHLVDALFDQYHIDVLGFDMVFAERDESSGLASLEAIGKTTLNGDRGFQSALDSMRTKLDYDRSFAESLKGRKIALGYVFKYGRDETATSGQLPAPTIQAAPEGIAAIPAAGYTANLPELQKAAAAGGYFSAALVDEDGIFRRVGLLENYQGKLYESLALAVTRLKLGVAQVNVGQVGGPGVGDDYSGYEWLTVGDKSVPIDEDVAVLIPYRGMQRSFPYVSATDVLDGKVAPETLRNAIVLLGTTAPGLMDLRSTPVGKVYPGVEVHANLIAGMLDQSIKQRPAYTLGIEFLSLLLVGLLLTLLLPALSPMWAALVSSAVLLANLAINLYAWEQANLVLPIASLLLMIVLIFVLNMSYGFFIESRGKRQLAGRFGQYVPPELVEEMAKDPGAFTLEGESREMSVLFSDVRGFTTISEGLDPKQLTHLMNEYLTPMTHVIHHYRGTIDKYMGDAIMAFWGAPLRDEAHARHALLAALDMLENLKEVQAQFAGKGWPAINIGVGINTGMMTVGNMGSEFRMAYTVMGDAVNLGSRLEGLTKEYGVQIIVSEFTRQGIPDFLFRELDCVRVKGKDKPVSIYEPICQVGKETAAQVDELALYCEALTLYREQHWDSAAAKFDELHKLYPERYLYEMYIKRIAYFRENPPGNGWDGAFTFKTK